MVTCCTVIAWCVIWNGKVIGHHFATDMRVLDLGVYDGVLRMDWLAVHSLVNCHWREKTLSFKRNGEQVHLHGVRPLARSPPSAL